MSKVSSGKISNNFLIRAYIALFFCIAVFISYFAIFWHSYGAWYHEGYWIFDNRNFGYFFVNNFKIGIDFEEVKQDLNNNYKVSNTMGTNWLVARKEDDLGNNISSAYIFDENNKLSNVKHIFKYVDFSMGNEKAIELFNIVCKYYGFPDKIEKLDKEIKVFWILEDNTMLKFVTKVAKFVEGKRKVVFISYEALNDNNQ